MMRANDSILLTSRNLFSLASLMLLAMLWALPASAENFPEPDGLKPDVAFWVRIYSEVDTKAGLIHDSRDLGVIYEKIQFTEGQSRRSRERQNEAAKKKIVTALKKLGKGRRSNLSDFERNVLSKFPEGVSNKTLAREHVMSTPDDARAPRRAAARPRASPPAPSGAAL